MYPYYFSFYFRRAICQEIIQEGLHPNPQVFRKFYGEMLLIPHDHPDPDSIQSLIWEVGSHHNISDVRISTSNYQRFHTAVSVHSSFRKRYQKKDKIASGEPNLVDTLTQRCNVHLFIYLFVYITNLGQQWASKTHHHDVRELG